MASTVARPTGPKTTSSTSVITTKMRANTLPGDGISQALVYDRNFLWQQVHWIRDDLDPQVARDGADALRADDLLKLDEFLRRLLFSSVNLDDMRYSRIHLAVVDICGRATRWPKRLIDRCDALQEAWEASYGPLKNLGILLYEPGGRLYDVCKPEELSKEKLIIRWIKSPIVRLSPVKALRYGDLGFKPGDWWINPLFAFREGIINSARAEGGVVADAVGAYAVVMVGDEEVAATSFDSFVFRARPEDKGRYRLTAATPESRHPVRILRSHTLRSFYAPKAGLRYDGLYKVTGWCIKYDSKTMGMAYDINFKRLPVQPSMDTVLVRPFTCEIEDYKEYKRLRHVAREKADEAKAKETTLKAKKSVPRLASTALTADGATDEPDIMVAALVEEESLPEFEGRSNAMEAISGPPMSATRKRSLLEVPPDSPMASGEGKPG